MKLSKLRRQALLFAAVTGIGVTNFAHASTYTWTNLTGSWFTDGAWSGQSWTNNNDALFNVAGLPVVTVDQDVVATSVSNGAANSTVTFNGANTVHLGAGGIVGTAATTTIIVNTPLTLDASQTWDKTTALVVNGVTTFTDGTTLTIRQGNNAFSNGSNTGSGTIVAGGGTVANETLQAAGSGSIFGTGVISLQARGRISGNDPAATARTIPNNLVIENTLSGTGAGMIGGQNNTGALTFTGNLTVNGTGTIQSDCGSAAGRSQSVTFAGTTTLKGTFNVFTQSTSGNMNTTTFSGPIVDDGTPRSFTKASGGSSGGGLVVFSGTNTYHGTTTVNGGTLALQSADLTNNLANSATINLGQGTANLDVSGIAPGFQVANGQLLTGVGKIYGNVTVGAGATIAAGSVSSGNGLKLQNNLTLLGAGTITYDLNRVISVAGGLTIGDGGTTTVSLPNLGNLSAGTFPLITYGGGLSGSGTFAVSAPPNTRANPTVDAATPGSVNLVINGSAANLVWAGDGAGNQWDVNLTSNWNNGGSSDKFFNLDKVTFDDSSMNTTVNVAQTVLPGSVAVNGSQTYTFQGAGAISGTSGLTVGGATLNILNSNNYTGGTTVNSGRLIVGNADAVPSGLISVSGGSLVLAPSLSHAVRAFPLTFTGGLVDLNNNKLIADYSVNDPIGTLTTNIQSGYNSGQWNGTSGIISSTAATVAADTGNPHKTGIGFGEASALGFATFGGVATDSTMVLMRYTYMGDANLDGTVNALDFNALASNFSAGGKSWINGDFNYDGNVDSNDFTMLATNFNLSLGAPGAALGTLVPEPASLCALGLASLGLLIRRRR